MNLSELFFFKVFPCNYNENDNNCIKPHNKKNCYFYHISHINDNGFEKKIVEDRRREPISFSKFFNSQYEKSKKEKQCSLKLDSIFELEKYENNFNFYIDSMPLEPITKENKIDFNMNFCNNETEFNYHMDRYNKNICRFWKINNKCKNEFCYNKHPSSEIKSESNEDNSSINNLFNFINVVNESNDGIDKYKKAITKWRAQKGIKLEEIIIIYKYILSFENRFLSIKQINLVLKDFRYFDDWEYSASLFRKPIQTIDSFLSEETSNINYYGKNNQQANITKKYSPLETLKINTNVCYISKYTFYKRAEIIKYVYAMLNSSDGVIIYGCRENDDIIKGITMTRKDRDNFKIWFNSEFIKILIKYEDNLKYDFIDINDINKDQCVLVIKIKKIKGNKFVIQYPNKCLIIKEKFLIRNKDEKNKLLDDENIKELDLKEYLEVLRIKLLDHYSKKFNIKI